MANEDVKGESLTVLIADDDAPTRILLRAAISQWGYQIVEAKDGEEAWKIIQETNAPQLLILDWLMPKLDGIAICELSKQLSNRPYIILLTQVTGTTNITKGLDAGADEFLSKPFNMAELRSRLSVGKKIVSFKKLLNDYSTKIENVEMIAQQVTDQLNGMSIKEAIKDEAQLQKLQTTLDQLMKIIKS